MRAATLFSGIGSPEVACPEIDWRWCAELEPSPSAVMAERYPNIPNLGDVTAEDFIERATAHGAIDLLVFGSPCQSFSVAGRRLGLDDPRGNLALIALGIVAELAPTWFVFENVPGLYSSWSGGEADQPTADEWAAIAEGSLVEGEWEWTESSDYASFIQWVDDIGYCGAWASLDAQWFGVAQRRRRVFFVGHSGDWRGPAAVLLEPDSLCGHPPTRGAAGEGATASVAPSIGASGRGFERAGESRGPDPVIPIQADAISRSGIASDHVKAPACGVAGEGDPMYTIDASAPHAVAYGGNRTAGPTEVATARNAHAGPHGRLDFETETFVTVADPLTAKHHGASGGKDSVVRNVVAQHVHENQRGEVTLSDTAGALKDGGGKPGQGYPAVITAFSSKDHGADAGETAPTLRAMGHDGSHANAGGQVAALTNPAGGGRSQSRMICDPQMAVRRLTPIECERLQGFPDNYTAVTYRGKPAADGPRYKALGNAMAVPVIGWILRRVLEVDSWRQV